MSMLAELVELIIGGELDRPVRPARRAGAKSHVIDAERAARDALARAKLAATGTGRPRGPAGRAAQRRERCTTAQRRRRALIITAPEQVRTSFRGHSTRAVIDLASRVRPGTATADVEAMLAGAAPIPAGSGKTVRHRLNRRATGTSTASCTPSPCRGCATTTTPAGVRAVLEASGLAHDPISVHDTMRARG